MIRGQSLRQLYESLGPVECVGKLGACLESGEMRPEDFSLRDLAESFCGEKWANRLGRPGPVSWPGAPPVLHWRRGEPMPAAYVQTPYGLMEARGYDGASLVDEDSRPLLEAGDGIDVSAFQHITGQIFFNKILDGWKNAALVAERFFSTVGTKLDGEKMPWLSHIFGEGDTDIKAGINYPEAQFGERYITTPRLTKQGHLISLTKEMVFFDRTGQALRSAGELGYKLGYNKEKRCLNVFLGLTNNYNLNGTAYNTYLTSGTNWINSQSGTPLVDFTSINSAYILSTQILDPDTGNPIVVQMRDLFVMPAQLVTANRIVAATEYRSTFPAYQAAASAPGNVQLISRENPLPFQLGAPLTSPIAYQLLTTTGGLTSTQANAYWFIGNFREAFNYMENWPLQVLQAPAQNIKEFEQDLVVRFKASERGTPVCVEPRYTFKMYNT